MNPTHFDRVLVTATMHTKSNTIRHTEFCYPQPESLFTETRVPRHQRYDARRSQAQNSRAFASFLSAVQALYCPAGRVKNLTVSVKHDTSTCFMCDKMTATMHQLRNRKGNGRFLRLGPVPPAHEPVVFEMTGVYLNVDTSAIIDVSLPMCSTCFAETLVPCDYFSPEKHMRDCKAAKSIMHRHWKKSGSWDCCSTMYPKKDANLPSLTVSL